MKKILSIVFALFLMSGCSLLNGPVCESEFDDTVYFAFDSSDLTYESQIAILNQIETIKETDSAVLIEGHADERGTREYNLGLGERRANAVAEYMIMKGVDEEKISTISYGKERPAVQGHNEGAWKYNRRAVTVLEEVE